MLHNWVQETTSTAGTGTITLGGAVAGYTTFASACATGETVEYVITDGANYEAGIGVFTAAGNTLSRAIVKEVLTAGVLTRNPAAGLSLSGTATVSISANANALMPSYPGSYLGEVCSGHLVGGFSYTQALASTYFYAMPFLLERGGRVASMKCRVTTPGSAGSVTRWALYEVASNGAFGRKLYETADVASATSGVKTDSPGTPLYLRPGWYYLGLVASNSPTLQACQGANQAPRVLGVAGTDSPGAVFYGAISAYAGGAMPAPPALNQPPGAWAVPVISMVIT